MAPAQEVEPKDLPPELMAPAIVPAAPPAVAMPAGLASSTPAAPAPLPDQAESLPAAALAARGLPGAVPVATGSWLVDLERDARRRLEAGEPDVWEALTGQFEGRLIHTALDITRGRRIEAAQKPDIGRNTITRKIQELGLGD